MNNEEKRQFYMDHIYSHRKDMYRILWSMFGDPDIVEEITQGVLEHAWKGLDTLKDQNKSWAWLKGILRNESRTHIRKKEESPAMEIWEPACEYIGEDDLLCYEQDILDSIVKKETGAQITELLEQMDEKYKSVIKMHLILQFSLKEIAKRSRQFSSSSCFVRILSCWEEIPPNHMAIKVSFTDCIRV